MVALADARAAEGVSETYQYLVGDSAFYFVVDDGSIELHDGQADNPAATLVTDEKTWADIVSGKITASAAAASGTLIVSGDRRAAKRLAKVFSRDRLLAEAEAVISRAKPQTAAALS